MLWKVGHIQLHADVREKLNYQLLTKFEAIHTEMSEYNNNNFSESSSGSNMFYFGQVSKSK